jgi:hypothetical protein
VVLRRDLSGTGAPQPEPGPSPEPPRCAPCTPHPGFACPLTASPAYCVAARSETAPSAAPGAH